MITLLCTVFLLILIVIVIPKKLSLSEYYATTLFALIFNLTIDIILNIQLGYYTYFQKGADLGGYIVVYVLGPCINIIFLNFLPKNRSLILQINYVLGWSILSILYEVLIAIPSDMIVYDQWKWWLSAISYPFIFSILSFHWLLIRKLLKIKD
jgi:hypothetical protein